MSKLEYALAFQLYLGLYGYVKIILSLTSKRIQFFLEVIRLAVHWIHLWSYLLLVD
jgi:hypothetical protein